MTNSKSKQVHTHDHDADHNHNHSHDHGHSHTSEKVSNAIGENTKIELIVDKKTAQKAYANALKKIAPKLKLSGFRKGKVPTQVAEKEIGTAEIIQQALEDVLPDIYRETITKLKKQPLTHPDIRPVSIEKDEEWKLIAEIAEAPAVDIKKYKDLVKKAVKTAETEWQKLIKEQKSDKNAEIQSENDQIKRKESFTLGEIYKNLVLTLKPAIPELLVRREVEGELQTLQRQLQSVKMTLQDFLERRKITPQQLSEQIAAEVVARLQLNVILGAIANQEKLSVSDQDYQDYLSKSSDPSIAEQAKQDPYYESWIRDTVLKQKITDFLLKI
ncbi:MAG: trigger factor [Microgenomates group bacterium]